MATRDAPTAPHPAPADDWILGEDGHWQPPPFTDAPSSRRRLERTVVVGPDVPPKPQKIGATVIVSMILVIAALAYLGYIALHG